MKVFVKFRVQNGTGLDLVVLKGKIDGENNLLLSIVDMRFNSCNSLSWVAILIDFYPFPISTIPLPEKHMENNA